VGDPPTGIPDLDRLLEGGFPHGRLSEIAGPLSSGRTSLALCLLARATRAGEMVAVVDAADAFDPASAQAAGARLDRVLWARAPGWREALRSAERLLEAHGFALVLLDLPSEGSCERRRQRERRSSCCPRSAGWEPPPSSPSS
jgi:recombination protein RecA